MNKEKASNTVICFIYRAKELLHDMEEFKAEWIKSSYADQDRTQEQINKDNKSSVQHQLSIHDLESCIMRQKMALDHLGFVREPTSTEIKQGDIVVYAGSEYEVAEVKQFPHGMMVGIYDEPPSFHVDYVREDSVEKIERY